MKLCSLFLGGLLMFGTSAVAQSGCRQVKGRIVEYRDAFNIVSIILPSRPSYIAATAVIPNSHRAAGAYVFALSRLSASDLQRSIEMLPAAIRLATEGHSSILLERVLTWPAVEETVGKMQPQVLCAEQWLSTHAATKADDWTFVGPDEDVPSSEQLHGLGDFTSMTFYWGLPLAGYRETRNIQNVLRDGIVQTVAALADSHESAAIQK